MNGVATLRADGNSGGFDTYENVVAASPEAYWLTINSCKPAPDHVSNCYVDNVSYQNPAILNCACGPVPNATDRCTTTNITVCDSASWPAAAKAIMDAAGP